MKVNVEEEEVAEDVFDDKVNVEEEEEVAEDFFDDKVNVEEEKEVGEDGNIFLPPVGQVALFEVFGDGKGSEIQISKNGNKYLILYGRCPYSGNKVKVLVFRGDLLERFLEMER